MNDNLYKKTFEDIIDEAEQAGMAAGMACTPEPMVIEGYQPISDGLCGFAWIRLKMTSPLGRYIGQHIPKSDQHASFRGWKRGITEPGLRRWVFEFNQSYAKKTAYAQAYMRILNSYGYQAICGSRLD